MTCYQYAIAIDGPSGAGKSSVARAVAAKTGKLYVDTGAMYRAVGLAVLRRGISEDDAEGMIGTLPGLQVTLECNREGQEAKVLLNGEDVSELIRTDEVAQYASKCSAVPEVREFLLESQRALARDQPVVMDGRDIGTVVLPEAGLKIFLTANLEVRARRRYRELLQRGRAATLDRVRADLEKRDAQDMNRPIAPLRRAPDAVLLDTSYLAFEEAVVEVLQIYVDTHRGCSQG